MANRAFVAAILLVLSIVGTAVVIRAVRGPVRVLLAACGVLFSLFVVLVMAGGRPNRLAHQMPAFDPTTYKGPTGKIVTPLRGDLSLMVYGHGPEGATGWYRLTSKDGTFVSPAGDMSLGTCDQVVTCDGSQWRLTSWVLQIVDVTPGSVSQVNIGPPYTASVHVDSTRDSRIRLSLGIHGRAEESCALTRDGRSDVHGFQILAMNGQVLQEGRFRTYG
jgi:hypothetical protein